MSGKASNGAGEDCGRRRNRNGDRLAPAVIDWKRQRRKGVGGIFRWDSRFAKSLPDQPKPSVMRIRRYQQDRRHTAHAEHPCASQSKQQIDQSSVTTKTIAFRQRNCPHSARRAVIRGASQRINELVTRRKGTAY